MAVPSYIGTGSGTNQTITSMTVPWHASTAVDDIVVIQCESSTSGTAVTAPTGFTLITSSQTGAITDQTRCTLFWKRMVTADITAGSVSITNPSNHIIAFAHTFRGCPLSGSPFGTPTAQANASSTTMTGNSVTTTATDSLVLFCSTIGNGGAGYTWTGDAASSGATWTMQFNVRGAAAGDGGAMALNTAPVATTGTVVGNVTQTIGTTDPAANVVVELKSGAVGPTAQNASGTATAYNPTVTSGFSTEGVSSTATAYNAQGGAGANAEVVPVTVTAYDALGGVGALPGAVTATATAFDATVVKAWGPDTATATATAFDARVVTTFSAETAFATATAGNGLIYQRAPDSRRWTIPPDDRSWTITSEDRTWTVVAEDRSWAIPAENRTWTIPAEDRGWIIPSED